ncbi:MAG: hypothetical protein ACI4XM_06945 [Candidatus Coprovivens sp.]
MKKYYIIKIFVEDYNRNIDQKKITEQIVDEICKILNCNYDRIGYMLLHPDYDFKDIGKMFTNKKEFYNVNIESKMRGKKHPNEFGAPSLIYEQKPQNNSEYSDFEIEINYPINQEYLSWEIVVQEKLLKNKCIELTDYKKILDLITKNGFLINTSIMHYYSGSSNRYLINGYDHIFSTFEEKKVSDQSINHLFEWKNKIIDIFLYNAFKKECLTEKKISELEELIGSNNIIFDDDYIIYTYNTSKSKYLMERYIPSTSKKKLRNFFKKNNMM